MLAEALGRVLHLAEPPRLVVAGRTDAGVHAKGQVVHTDVAEQHFVRAPGRSTRTPEQALVARLAGVLDPDVVVRAVTPVPETFDARFSALSRRYRYLIADTPHRPQPLQRAHVAWLREPLDTGAMHRAAQPLLGEHDFVAYCRPRAGASTVRTLRQLDVTREASGLVAVELVADAFCHNQVRALTGALVDVGRGRRPDTWPAEVLRSRRRDGAVHVAPAHGLTLEHIEYPPDDELALQATRARTHRGGSG